MAMITCDMIIARETGRLPMLTIEMYKAFSARNR